MSVYIDNILQILKKCLIMISPKHSIIATITGNVIDITYVGEREIHTVFTYYRVTYHCLARPVAYCSALALTVKAWTPLDIYRLFE